MLNFAVGPVMSEKEVLMVGSEQVPYFRTAEFSKIMLENEMLMKKFVNAPENSRAVFITGSGTASMEASIINLFDSSDKLLVVNGGSFGSRFVKLCEIHKIPFTEIPIEMGKDIKESDLAPYAEKGYTGLLVNVHETSTGVHYNIEMISEFCKKNSIFLVIDAISSFLADPINMQELDAGVIITGSQKALACAPGISIIVLSPEGVDRCYTHCSNCMYLDLKSALQNGERGQTPFTPAVGILRQINVRLKSIEANGGIDSEINRTKSIAEDFRKKIKDLPFEIASESLSNAVTPIHPLNVSAYSIFETLKNEYGIWVCPNGGDLADKVFRVGHMGALTPTDNTTLVCAFNDLKRRGLI